MPREVAGRAVSTGAVMGAGKGRVMYSSQPVSVLIGGESLLIECARALGDRGHRIAAVVSTAPAVLRWATEQGYAVLADAAELLRLPGLGQLDYLFSITNLAVLPPQVIAMPRRAAVNFHDGPLPEYAGLNTPVWALANGESAHGVTWHLMTDQVDRGGVLVERRFVIGDGDTALALNTRCFEAGLETFTSVLDLLQAGDLAARPEAGLPRRMYRRRDRPMAAGVIDWTLSADQLSRWARALDFGGYANPVGSLKLLSRFQDGAVCVRSAQVSREAAPSPPGTVLGIDGEAIEVACNQGAVRLSGFETTCGRSMSADQAARRLGLEIGSACVEISGEAADRVTALDAQTGIHEAFWRDRLATQAALELPHVDRGRMPSQRLMRHLDVGLLPGEAGSSPEGIAASLVAWLARVSDKAAFDLGWEDSQTDAAIAALPSGLWSRQRPIRLALAFERGIGNLAADLSAQIEEVRRRGPMACDIVGRTPALRHAAQERDPRQLPVVIRLVDLQDGAPPEGSTELALFISPDLSSVRWWYDAGRLEEGAVHAMIRQWLALARAAWADEDRAVSLLPWWGEGGLEPLLRSWSGSLRTDVPVACVHHLFERQATLTPDRVAVASAGKQLTYAELDQRAERLALELKSLGVAPGSLVAVGTGRGLDLAVALLGIHKSGGAYVPLDPTYPADRLEFMLQDSGSTILLTQGGSCAALNASGVRVLDIGSLQPATAAPQGRCAGGARPDDLAYVIYTSGSTGKPKGVMIEHRQVVNFFAGMDEHLGGDEPGTWLAVTSLSFDISVLELLWTLCRGYTVVVALDEEKLSTGGQPALPARGPHASRPLEFSLFYFSADAAQAGQSKYRLLLEGARFADSNGFSAVWTPERHFHAFGGLYPNPAVTGAAVAAITSRVGIRAGSVVLPLHHPARVVEEWSVVDNLSGGRVGISFASGWQPNDFVLRPENYADNKAIMLRDLEVVRRLWRGEAATFRNPLGKDVEIKTLPRPVQTELPYWVTSAGNPQTFAEAGRIGARVLTHLLGQTVEELAEKIAVYRKAYREAGHPGEGFVSLMLHTFVGPDVEQVRRAVRQPLIDYLKTSLNLVKQYAWTFPAFKKREGMGGDQASIDLQSLAAEEMDALMEYSFERYYQSSGLFGSPQTCLEMIDRIKSVGVDDVACLIDFGVDPELVLEHLPHLARLRELSEAPAAAEESPEQGAMSLGGLMRRHRVTHLQCTPSMARMLVQDPLARPGLGALKRMLVGGEAFPPALAAELAALVGGKVMNMYGPTETTVWSATQVVDSAVSGPVPLGRPLANQKIYILDSRQQPLPEGVHGELVIAGHGVVRGYLHRPELTAERFLADHVAGEGRMYRTGDLARRRADGVLEFLGRIDHQVKVRGYRIELGEIEAVISRNPDVAANVVAAREDSPGDARLVAYVVARGQASLDPAALREGLRATLPDFMVPSHVVVLAQLPQTPNGKVDRKALPAPDAQPAATAPLTFEAPAGDVEETIARVWREVLKVDQVGTRDNFFDLGGHSLLAVQAHRRLREALARDLSITDIFRFPTIQSLAGYLAGGHEDVTRQAADRAQGRRAAMQRRQALRSGAG